MVLMACSPEEREARALLLQHIEGREKEKEHLRSLLTEIEEDEEREREERRRKWWEENGEAHLEAKRIWQTRRANGVTQW